MSLILLCSESHAVLEISDITIGSQGSSLGIADRILPALSLRSWQYCYEAQSCSMFIERGYCPIVSALDRALDILSVLRWGMGASPGPPAVPTSCWVLSQRMLTGQRVVFLTLRSNGSFLPVRFERGDSGYLRSPLWVPKRSHNLSPGLVLFWSLFSLPLFTFPHFMHSVRLPKFFFW